MHRDDWPHEVPRQRVLANFRQPTLLRPRPPTYAERRAGNDRNHLALIGRLTCLVCPEREGIDAHHLKSGPARAERAFGRKATDRWALPLCRMDHDDLERLPSTAEEEWFASFGIMAPHLIALRFWNETRPVKPGRFDDVIGRLQRIEDGFKREAIAVLSARCRAAR